MSQSPNIGKKRVIQKGRSKIRYRKVSKKQRSQLTGTFQHKARRASILGERVLGKRERVCPDCFSVYYDKHWHAPSFFGGKRAVRSASLLSERCTECTIRAKARGSVTFAGEVTLKGEFSPEEQAELLRLVRNVGKRATKRDPQDRIIHIDSSGTSVKIFTTENQLAVSIGKQIHRARKGTTLTITWSHDDKPVRVLVRN